MIFKIETHTTTLMLTYTCLWKFKCFVSGCVPFLSDVYVKEQHKNHIQRVSFNGCDSFLVAVEQHFPNRCKSLLINGFNFGWC